ncbi:MAG: MBL fold metallo-hydrolase [Deltaproteobacteria bacterium]|nr:MBL fold metallo-hydrolase [Deltaproteobacteria bacterium]
MEADIDFVLLSEGKKTLIDDIEVSNIKLNHPGGAFGYRAQKGDAALVYATDTEVANIDSPEMKKYINFFSGAKILVFDSQYTLVEAFEKEDWGHSSSLKGVDIMTEAGVDTLVLFHHEPTYDDRTLWDIFQRTSKYAKLQGVNSASRVIMAYEGLELTI